MNTSENQRQHRPSLWFLGPTLLALVLHAQSHRDVLWASLCATGIIGSYVSSISFPWPRRRSDVFRGLMVMMALWLAAYSYFEIVLEEGRSLPYFPRFVMKPWFISSSSMWVAALLVWFWYMPLEKQGRSASIYMLTGWIVLSSCQFLNVSDTFRLILVLYCAAVMIAMIMTGLGHATWGTTWWPRPRQWLIYGIWLIVLGWGTWSMVGGLHQLQEQLPRLFGRFFRPPSFSGHVGTRDVMMIRRQQNIRLSSELVAAISGDREPGYMRTQVLTRYKRGMWSSPRYDWPISAQILGNSQRFVLHEMPPTPTSKPSVMQGRNAENKVQPWSYEVQTFRHLDGSVLLSYGAQWLITQKKVRCLRRMGHSLSCDPEERLGRYRFERVKERRLSVGTGEATLPGSAELALKRERVVRKVELREPVSMLRRRKEQQDTEIIYRQLRPLALRVVGESNRDPLVAAQRVQDYFRRNYTYSLQVKLSKQGDPTVDFVLNQKPAFCEYFASGMALVLRSLGIQARVATGFLVTEKHSLSGKWLVRQRDAHAWTEVYDAAKQRWIAYDATAPDMLMRPQVSGIRGSWDNLWSWVQLRWQEWIVWVRHGNFREWLTQQFSVLIERIWTWKTAVVVLLIWLLFELWQQRSRWWMPFLRWLGIAKRIPKVGESSESVPTQEEVRRRMEAFLFYWAKQGWPIAEHETLEEYSARLEKSAETSGETSGEVSVGSEKQQVPPFAEVNRLIPLYNALRFTATTGVDKFAGTLRQWQELMINTPPKP